ncbi:hypothetical protein L2E82_17392 [Cichorium intybus]|uniref:Uncharacterized protein n=1 Tax=Cichorium intybus TaxID=13427 RepID=A0ACB9F845_CICIN|nr:hypothetical protein L2E82_17392 [Cichorium intybus]
MVIIKPTNSTPPVVKEEGQWWDCKGRCRSEIDREHYWDIDKTDHTYSSEKDCLLSLQAKREKLVFHRCAILCVVFTGKMRVVMINGDENKIGRCRSEMTWERRKSSRWQVVDGSRKIRKAEFAGRRNRRKLMLIW